MSSKFQPQQTPNRSTDDCTSESERASTHSQTLALLEQAWELRTEDPVAAEAAAREALDLLEKIEPTELPRRKISDLRAQAWIHMANARRIRSDLRAAESMLKQAEVHLQAGTHAPQERARLLLIQAGLLAELRSLPEAIDLMEQVIAIHRWAKDRKALTKAFLTKAHIHQTAGELEKSLACLDEAEPLIEPDDEPRLWLWVKQIRLLQLHFAGRLEEARELLPEVLYLVENVGNRLEKIRVEWTKGLILGKLKQVEAAEETLRKVRHDFLQENISYDAAQVSLDLAVLLLESNRLEETRELAEEMLPLFESLDIRREAFAALILFHRAALQDKATAGMVRDIAAFLKRTGGAPALKYEKPS